MALLLNDHVTQLAFSVRENKGVFAVLLGSGISRPAGIPTGWEITLDLVRRVALANNVPEQSDWEKWHREQTGEKPNYSTLLEKIACSADERRAVLHSYIEPNEQDCEEGRKTPTKAHRAIAQLVREGYVRVIVTTNFDRLMENALREQGVEPTVVASPDALKGAEPLTHSRCYVLKLHGDYKDARILNTDQELSVYPDAYNLLLDRIFDEFGLVICGWSSGITSYVRPSFGLQTDVTRFTGLREERWEMVRKSWPPIERQRSFRSKMPVISSKLFNNESRLLNIVSARTRSAWICWLVVPSAIWRSLSTEFCLMSFSSKKLIACTTIWTETCLPRMSGLTPRFSAQKSCRMSP